MDKQKTKKEVSVSQTQAAVVLAGPVLLLIGILYHPFIVRLTNNADVVNHLVQDTTRWFLAHMIVALASAVLLLSFLAVRSYVRALSSEPWTARAVPPLVIGTILFVMLPAMEIAMLAVHKSGADLLTAQNALNTWFVPVLLSSSIAFGIGVVLFAKGISKSAILPAATGRMVVAAFVVGAISRFIPMTLSLIIGAAALVVAFAPLASDMWEAASS